MIKTILKFSSSRNSTSKSITLLSKFAAAGFSGKEKKKEAIFEGLVLVSKIFFSSVSYSTSNFGIVVVTVTFFAFDQGQGLSEHSAPFDAMVQIIDGEAEITISGVKNTVKAGEIIIMPANEPHALQAVNSPYKMILTMIKSD